MAKNGAGNRGAILAFVDEHAFASLPLPPFLREMVGRLKAFCHRECLFAPERAALVMVSGGADSLTLLHVLSSGLLGADGPRSVRALHVNYGLRGAESDADEDLVREVCARWDVPLEVRSAPLTKNLGNLQERAREMRREAALSLSPAGPIAVGHTRDDQVETLLYRMGRYGGVAALRGMEPRTGVWVRPLLVVSRRETQAYCDALGQPFAVDRGNVDPSYARTRLREQVLPLLDEVLPGFHEAAARTGEVAAEVLRVAMAGSAEAASSASGVWSTSRIRAMDPGRRRLALWMLLDALPDVTPTRALVLEVERALETDGSLTVPLGAGTVLAKEYGRARVVRETTGAASPDLTQVATLPVPGRTTWAGLTLVAEATESFRAPDPAWEAYLDARGLPNRLTVRGPKPGDRLRPLGAPGSRSLQDVFVDRRVPTGLRGRVPVVLAGERIVWVGGLAGTEESRMRRDSVRLVRLAVETGTRGGTT